MNKFLIAIGFFFYPLLLLADSSALSFTPPPTDYSVGFLSNIFGMVDGVLHGTGSQMMGSIFTVFNAAVLALGGIIIMYTLIVGTLNTAHEGKMLGQKWSSIWIPVRSTVGLALLIPKASGYCLMQIFVMWTVVQGVGAADKVWNSALAYLNRGGVIVKTSMTPETSSNADQGLLAKGAGAILSGEVCMLGLQKLLEVQREVYLNQKSSKTGQCYVRPGSGTANELDEPWKTFCTTTVPDFLATVDASTFQSKNYPSPESEAVIKLPLPNFDATQNPLYSKLNGICGEIQWNPIRQAIKGEKKYSNKGKGPGGKTHNHTTQSTDIEMEVSTLTSDDMETIRLSRATAIQQIYLDYIPVATSMISNDPEFDSKSANTSSTTNPAFQQAVIAFGVPYTTNGSPCTSSDATCSLWRSAFGSALFAGTEFQYALLDYNAIMMPTVNLISQARGKANLSNKRSFIAGAQAAGWMNAGSYFFDLISLNGSSNNSLGSATNNQNATDEDTGLDKSFSNGEAFATGIPGGGCNDLTAPASTQLLCTLFQSKGDLVKPIGNLVGTPSETSSTPVQEAPKNSKSIDPSSTVEGFRTNGMIIQIPGGQVPFNVTTFKMPLVLEMKPDLSTLPKYNFPCGRIGFKYVGGPCVGQILGDAFYNNFIRWIINIFVSYTAQLENDLLMIALYIPLKMISVIFTNGVNIIQTQDVNPIIALAEMGAQYINESVKIWFQIINIVLDAFLNPIIPVLPGFVAIACVILVSPLLISWMGVMVAIGFSTAYYLPFLPYMVFTFGTIAWLMAVIEAMVAAPIVALGVTHPEGEGILGKGEAAVMILMNIFLRPSMMIIGYIAAIALCYVSVWIINAGFSNVLKFIQNEDIYTTWAGIYAFFFGIVIYTTMYLTVAEKSFTLIYKLPDEVLRWIGGHAEQTGQQAAGWTEPVKQKSDEAAKSTLDAQAQVGKKITGMAVEAAGAGADAIAPGSGEVVKGVGKAATS